MTVSRSGRTVTADLEARSYLTWWWLGVMFYHPLNLAAASGGGVCQFTSDGIGVVLRRDNEKPLRAYPDHARTLPLSGKIMGCSGDLSGAY
jgi:hypothetical protein